MKIGNFKDDIVAAVGEQNIDGAIVVVWTPKGISIYEYWNGEEWGRTDCHSVRVYTPNTIYYTIESDGIVYIDRLSRNPFGGDRLKELQSMPYKEYLATDEWNIRMNEKLLEVGFRCQVCYHGGCKLICYHRTRARIGNESSSDLTVLCRDCYELFKSNIEE